MENKKIDVGEVAERLGRPVILNIRKTIHSKRKRNRVTVNNVGEYEKLSISYVVDNLPFSKMLSLGENAKPEDSIPFVTRAYEERYMRPAQIAEEDNCVMGDECECMHIDENKKFIGVQFVLPDLEHGESCGLCILCLRKMTQLLYYHCIHKGVQCSKRIQKYGNICGEKGEYHPSAVLMCPSNVSSHIMPLPIVGHQRNRYSVIEISGTYRLKQHRVYQEDF